MVSDGLVLRLLACDYEPGPDGFLTLAASAPRIRLEVLTGDWMQVGFAAMREGAGPVRAWPRLLREVCANGSLVCISELDRHEGTAGIAEAHYGAAVAALREASVTGVDDWRDRLDLEEFAGRIAWLRRPTPSLTGGATLLPA